MTATQKFKLVLVLVHAVTVLAVGVVSIFAIDVWAQRLLASAVLLAAFRCKPKHLERVVAAICSHLGAPSP